MLTHSLIVHSILEFVCGLFRDCRPDLDVTVFAIATVHLQDQYTANTLHHSFYYRRIGKWGHFSVFQQNKDISKSCYAMDQLKGHNQIS